jgi:hypothetical protein
MPPGRGKLREPLLAVFGRNDRAAADLAGLEPPLSDLEVDQGPTDPVYFPELFDAVAALWRLGVLCNPGEFLRLTS